MTTSSASLFHRKDPVCPPGRRHGNFENIVLARLMEHCIAGHASRGKLTVTPALKRIEIHSNDSIPLTAI